MRTQRQISCNRLVKGCTPHNRNVLQLAVLAWLTATVGVSHGQTAGGGASTNRIQIVQIEGAGLVEVLTPNSTTWEPTTTKAVLGPNFRVRTGLNTRAVLRWSDQS